MTSPTPAAIAKFRRHGDSLKAQSAKLRHLLRVSPPKTMDDITCVMISLTIHLDMSMEILDAAMMCISHEAGGKPTTHANGDSA